MFNRFFMLKVAVCKFSSDGWIKQHRKDDIIEEFSIPLIDVNQFPYIKGPVKLI